MSLLIKALKKAEKDNKLAVDATLDPGLELQIDKDPLSLADTQQPTSGSTPNPGTTGKKSPDKAGLEQPGRTPLAFADDNAAHQPAQPALDTPRHATRGAQGVQHPADNPAEPGQQAESLALERRSGELGESGKSNRAGNPNESGLEPLGTQPPDVSVPAVSHPAPESPAVSESTPRAQPMAIAHRNSTPRWLVGGVAAAVIASVLAWSGLTYLRGQADIPGYQAATSLDDPDNVLPGAQAQSPTGPVITVTSSANEAIPSTGEGDKVESTPGGSPADNASSSNAPRAARQSKSKQVVSKPTAPLPPTAPRQVGNQAGKGATSIVKRSTGGTTVAADAPALPAVRFVRRDETRAKKMAALNSAYQLLRSGQLGAAQAAYEQVLKQDRNLSDAWIGLASIAARQGDATTARMHYERALRINPNDAVAQAGLATLSEEQNLVSQESRLRNLAARNSNDAAVQFALGNALAAQRRWAEAQQAYFLASAADPAQPDYAFNLAVSLEQMRQPAAALPHYERALRAAQDAPARFDQAIARSRISALSDALKR